MHLSEYVDSERLANQIKNGMIKVPKHPSLPLEIYNYTQKAQYTPELWDDVTDKCRGLIVNGAGKIVSRPFVKFWNFGDARHPETLPANLPAGAPVITRKMDGSLGILWAVHGTKGIATRGSFTSDQAAWATRWLHDQVPNLSWPHGYTLLWEIVYPENQIVVRYDFSGLVLLAAVDNETGGEMPYPELLQLGARNGVRVVDQFDKPLDLCVTEDIDNEEGYVATWQRPGTWPLRVKIKMETYCRLHRLLTQTNPVTVWEMLKDGLGIESVTENAPAEFTAWINGVEEKLRKDYRLIEDKALRTMLDYKGERNVRTPEDRKQFALYATQQPSLAPILFAMLDRKPYDQIIWKQLRPRGDERSYRVDIDG